MEALQGPWPDVPDAVRRVMRANTRRDTRPELLLRSALHAVGLRYRVDHAIRPDDQRPIRPDIVFTRRRVVVFVDGCFWHGCPEHHRPPTTNGSYWAAKVARNQARDVRDRARLERAGWKVIRVWEHESLSDMVTDVLGAYDASSSAACARITSPAAR